MKNKEVAQVLTHIAELLEMQSVPFKPRAYEHAARAIEELSQDINEICKLGKLQEIPGVGESIAHKITELLTTGKLDYYEELKKELPVDVEELMRVPGLGPKRIMLLYKELGVKDIAGLKKAAEGHLVQHVKGLGPTVEADILRGIALVGQGSGRFLLGHVTPLAEEIRDALVRLKSVSHVEFGGSYRRRKETVGDIDILVLSDNQKKVMDFFVHMDNVVDVLVYGMTKSAVRLRNGMQVDVRVLQENEYGSALQYFTGNKEHNVKLRQLALSKGYTLSEYGLFTLKKKKWVAGRTEEEIYQKLGVDWMPPELRENMGEIEAGQQHRLPALLDYGQCHGDFQTQTTWSDGADTIDIMARAALAKKWTFLTITDHVGQLAIAHALDEKRLLEQAKEIDKLNEKLGIHIFKGAEVDILKNGRLALSKKVQEKLDVVLASVHLSTKMSEKEMTARICSALEHDRVHILGHPTGRLINQREAYPLDMQKLFETAQRTGTFLEINGQPERMDLKDVHVKAAKEAGCSFVISSDAHSVGQLDYVQFGEAIARRGWCEAKNVVNTYPLQKIITLLRRK